MQRRLPQIVSIWLVLSATLSGIQGCSHTTNKGGRDSLDEWAVYRDPAIRFAFQYPDLLVTVTDSAGGRILRHKLALQHPDPCDFVGDRPPLSHLTDFDVYLDVSSDSLGPTIRAHELDYLQEHFLVDGQPVIEPGFIDRYDADGLTGYRVTEGAEGCGEYRYYFPLRDQRTLFVRRRFITELDPVIGKSEEYLRLPGVVPPADEERIFRQVLGSFRTVPE